MFRKSRIAMLVAGALFTAQTGLVLANADDDAIAFSESSSSLAPEQVTVFNPDGSSYTMTSGDTLIALESDAMAWDDSWSSSGSQQLTVFNPDGSAYSIAPVSIEVAMLEPAVIAMADDSLPQQMTVYEPSGFSYSYELTPADLAMVASIDEDNIFVTEPVIVAFMDEDTSIAPLAVIDEDADLRPTYVAHFVSPPEYTGILEESLS